MISEKIFVKLMNKAVFRKTIKNGRKHRDQKLVTTAKRRNYLVSQPNYHTRKFSPEICNRNEKNRYLLINKSPQTYQQQNLSKLVI